MINQRYLCGEHSEYLNEFFSSIKNDFSHSINSLELEKIVNRTLFHGKAVVSEKNGKIVAACTYFTRPDKIKLVLVGVAQDHRSTTTLYRLLDYAAHNEAHLEHLPVVLHAHPKNLPSRAVIEKIGFRNIGTANIKISSEPMLAYSLPMSGVLKYFDRRHKRAHC